MQKKENEEKVPSEQELRLTRIPESVSQRISHKNQEILQRFESRQSRPQVILVLERSAVLPASSVVSEIRQKYPQTQIVNVAVGKVLPYMFAEHKMSIDDDFDEVDLNLSDRQQAAEFMVWLNNTKDFTVQHLLKTLKNLRLQRKNILVIDDARSSGETADLTLPLLLQAAYPGSVGARQKQINTETEVYFEGSFSWEQAVIAELGLSLSPAEAKLMSTVMKGSFDLRRFKIELESGFYDTFAKQRHLSQMKSVIRRKYNKGTNGIVPVDSSIILKMAGYQALMQVRNVGKSSETENPAYRLLQEYGMDGLINLSRQVAKKFKEI